jgi:hypothetical protein
MNVSLESGNGLGYAAGVTEEGQLQVDVGNTVTVQRTAMEVVKTRVTATGTSGTLVSARPGRQSFFAQNQGANNVFLHFASGAATNQDWLLLPGAEFRAEELRYEGEVTVISAGGNSVVVALETAP